MNLLDIYENREPYQQAIDKLEQRRIKDLEERMDDCARRGDVKGFRKAKEERDSYYNVKDECMGYGTLVGEDVYSDYAGTYSPEAITLGKKFCEHYNITDDDDIQFAIEIIDNELEGFKHNNQPVDLKRIRSSVADAFRQAFRGIRTDGPNFRKHFKEAGLPDKEAGLPDVADKAKKMARLNQPGKVGTDAVTPQQRVNPNPDKGVIGHAIDWLRGKGGPGKEGPTYESKLSEQEEEQAQKELGVGYGVYQELLQAWNDKKPYVQIPMPGGEVLTITRNQVFNVLYALKNMNDNTFKKTLQTAFTSLPKFMVWSNSIKRYQLPPEKPNKVPGQMNLPGITEAGQKKNSKKDNQDLTGITAKDATVQRELQKVRARHPAAQSDIEALVKDEIVQQEKNEKEFNQLHQELTQSQQVNQQQSSKIADLERKIATARTIPTVGATPSVSATKVDMPKTTSTAPVDKPQAQPVVQTIFVSEPERLPQKDQEIYQQVKNLETELKDKIDAIATWNKVATTDDESRNELDMLRNDMERTKREINRKIKALQKSGVQVQQAPLQQELPIGTPASRNYLSNLRQQLGRSVGDTLPTAAPIVQEPELNVLTQDDLDQLGSLERSPAEVKETKPSTIVNRSIAAAKSIPAIDARLQKHQQKRQELERLRAKLDAEMAQKASEEEAYWKNHALRATRLKEPSTKLENQNLDTHAIYIDNTLWKVFANASIARKEARKVINSLKYQNRNQKVTVKPYVQGVTNEGFQDFKKVEPYAVCLAGKPVKTFDYYEQARQFHDNWKKKLYREGNKEKADKITLMPIMKEDTGSWICYDPETKQIKKRFKTHTAGKSYAKAHNLGFASSEYYFDNVKQAAVAEGLTPDEIAKLRKDAEANVKTTVDKQSDARINALKNPPKEKSFMQQVGDKQIGMVKGAWKGLTGQNEDQGVAEVATDYSKRRQRERDIDAGKPVAKQRQPKMTDYQKRRAQDKKDLELGEGLMKDPTNRKEYLDQRDKLLRMLSVESDLANKQIIKQAVKELDARFGSSLDRSNFEKHTPKKNEFNIREESSTSSEEAESAILKRIMVAHLDLLMKYGPEKVTQAVEEVAYGVGDLDEIGSSDVSGWVRQVEQILGEPELLDEMSFHDLISNATYVYNLYKFIKEYGVPVTLFASAVALYGLANSVELLTNDPENFKQSVKSAKNQAQPGLIDQIVAKLNTAFADAIDKMKAHDPVDTAQNFVKENLEKLNQ